jgi:transposase
VSPTSEKDLARRRKQLIDAGMRTWYGSRINDTTLAELVAVLNRPGVSGGSSSCEEDGAVARRSTNYPPELRERAVRMVAQVRPEHPSDWPAIRAVAEKLGIGTAQTLRKWVRQAEVDAGQRTGVTSEESAEIRRLKRRTPSYAR